MKLNNLQHKQSHPSLTIEDKFLIKETIGKGTFGKVKLGFNKETNTKVAIKILEKSRILSKDDSERVERELSIISKFSNSNVIQTYELINSKDKFYIIMEYCEGGELFNHIVEKQRLPENEAACYYYQLINGLEYIHNHNVVHRDLKPENLLLGKENILKIIDFGLSNYFNGKPLATPCGSPCYASPEMVSGNKYNGFFIDVWSTGIILFAMLCGYLPFEDDNNDVLFSKILQCRLDYPGHISTVAKSLLQKILVTNPEKRIKLNEIKKHAFYLQGRAMFNIEHNKSSSSQVSKRKDIKINIEENNTTRHYATLRTDYNNQTSNHNNNNNGSSTRGKSQKDSERYSVTIGNNPYKDKLNLLQSSHQPININSNGNSANMKAMYNNYDNRTIASNETGSRTTSATANDVATLFKDNSGNYKNTNINNNNNNSNSKSKPITPKGIGSNYTPITHQQNNNSAKISYIMPQTSTNAPIKKTYNYPPTTQIRLDTEHDYVETNINKEKTQRCQTATINHKNQQYATFRNSTGLGNYIGMSVNMNGTNHNQNQHTKRPQQLQMPLSPKRTIGTPLSNNGNLSNNKNGTSSASRTSTVSGPIQTQPKYQNNTITENYFPCSTHQNNNSNINPHTNTNGYTATTNRSYNGLTINTNSNNNPSNANKREAISYSIFTNKKPDTYTSSLYVDYLNSRKTTSAISSKYQVTEPSSRYTPTLNRKKEIIFTNNNENCRPNNSLNFNMEIHENKMPLGKTKEIPMYITTEVAERRPMNPIYKKDNNKPMFSRNILTNVIADTIYTPTIKKEYNAVNTQPNNNHHHVYTNNINSNGHHGYNNTLNCLRNQVKNIYRA